MNVHFAMLFPGQGSQSVGMLHELATQYQTIRETFEQAEDTLKYDLWHLVQNNPDDKLNQTEYTQPALLTANVAIFKCWQELGGKEPTIMAGHSLGEYSALVCADSMKFESALRLVALRGRLMQAALPSGSGAMAAIVGLDENKVSEICLEAAEQQIVAPANYNSIQQTVIAGHTEAVERAIILAKAEGAKIAKHIPVSVPSHCKLMQSAAEKLAIELSKIALMIPTIQVIQNVDVTMHSDLNTMREQIIQQLVAPVRWVETIQKMEKTGINAFIECGPGKVLTGINKRLVGGALPTFPTESVALLKKAIESIKELEYV